MTEPTSPIEIAFRIPGTWSHPKELLDLLSTDCELTSDTLTLADGTQVGFGATKADDEFAEIFHSSCRQPPSPDELATVANYKANVVLWGSGGSLPAARSMMRAATAVVRAGGAGVFIDNSALAHGGENWMQLTEDGGPDAMSFAFVSIVGGQTDAWTMGMHVLGFPDLTMKREHAQAEEFGIIDAIVYFCKDEKPVEDGHIFADLNGPRFQAVHEENPPMPEGSPMYNPFGRLKLVSIQDIAESN